MTVGNEPVAKYQNLQELEYKINSLLPSNAIDKKPSSDLHKLLQQWSDAVWSLSKENPPFHLSNEMIQHGITIIQHAVFICGVHRSGTTLLRDLLDDHPNLSVLPSEGSYFTNLAPQLKRLTDEEKEKFIGKEWLRRLVNPINQPPYWVLGKSQTGSSPYVEFARIFQSWYQYLKKQFPDSTIYPHLAIVIAFTYCNNDYSTKQLWVDQSPALEKFLLVILS
jgi:hypothetical protein